MQKVYGPTWSFRIAFFLLAGVCFILSYGAIAGARVLGFQLWYILLFFFLGISFILLCESFRLTVAENGVEVFDFLGRYSTEWSNISYLGVNEQGLLLVLKEPRKTTSRGLLRLLRVKQHERIILI